MAEAVEQTPEGEGQSWSDERLVRECLQGNQEAWSALIDKYKNLIFSIPFRFEFSREDAADIFQSVIAEMLSELGRLREPRALAAWLIQVTSHKCLQWRREQQRHVGTGEWHEEANQLIEKSELREDILHQAACEQKLREALWQVSPRCRQLIQMLFFESPARPYEEVARNVGIATGSMGFTRRRCLDRLRSLLEKAGFS